MFFNHHLNSKKLFDLQYLGDGISMESADKPGIDLVAMPELHKLNGSEFSFGGVIDIEADDRPVIDEYGLEAAAALVLLNAGEKAANALEYS